MIPVKVYIPLQQHTPLSNCHQLEQAQGLVLGFDQGILHLTIL